MKQYKIYIFIAIIFVGVCAFNIVDAIRIDFLNKPTGLQQPPLTLSPNISGSINSNGSSGQLPQTSSNYNLLPNGSSPNHSGNSLENSVLASKNILHPYNFIWWIIFIIIGVIIIFIIFLVAKKRGAKR